MTGCGFAAECFRGKRFDGLEGYSRLSRPGKTGARYTLKHRLAQGVVGTAGWLRIMFRDMYVLAPEDPDGQEKVLECCSLRES